MTFKSEGAVLNDVRLLAAKSGIFLWRNNVGATYTKDGGFVRYGLCNDTPALNRRIKSSDLIGITPILVTPKMVGTVIGQFTAIETKHANWVYRGTEREEAQRRFIMLVNRNGGRAMFVRDAEEILP